MPGKKIPGYEQYFLTKGKWSKFLMKTGLALDIGFSDDPLILKYLKTCYYEIDFECPSSGSELVFLNSETTNMDRLEGFCRYLQGDSSIKKSSYNKDIQFMKRYYVNCN